MPRIDGFTPTLSAVLLYPLYVVLGTLIMYSVMVTLSATSVWLGRNQTLYDFWFYITNFSRYPLEIYNGPIGIWLRWAFLFIIPVLVVANVPARLLAKPFQWEYAYLAAYGVLATLVCLFGSRWIFQRALESYRQRQQLIVGTLGVPQQPLNGAIFPRAVSAHGVCLLQTGGVVETYCNDIR